jgi:hypothetical protein
MAGEVPSPQAGPADDEPGRWAELEPGLALGEFEAPQKAAAGDSMVRVLRIDPHRWELRLLNASAPDQGRIRTAKEWCRKNGLVAAINSSMYQTDYRKSVSLMRSREHVNNPRLSKDNTILAFDPLEEGLPPVRLIDLGCHDFEDLRARYGSLVQSIRMISCRRENVWKQQARAWSTAAIGVDGDGRVLFIHVRSPYTTHDLIENLLALPLDLAGAMYTEGGAEAQLYVAAGGVEHEFVGRFDSPLLADMEAEPVAIPNVIGVARRGPVEVP